MGPLPAVEAPSPSPSLPTARVRGTRHSGELRAERVAQRAREPRKPTMASSASWCSKSVRWRRYIAPQRGQIRAHHTELLTQVLPEDRLHDTDGVEQSAAHPQEADLERQAQAQRRPAAILDRAALGRREGEEGLELEGRQIARNPSPAQVRSVPVLHSTLSAEGTIP
jgi:hypothetical protein